MRAELLGQSLELYTGPPLGGVAGDSAVTKAMSDYAKAWQFKHPSPWDYMFFMNKALGRDLKD